MWQIPRTGYCKPARTNVPNILELCFDPMSLGVCWYVRSDCLLGGENNLQSEPCGFRARAKPRRVGVDGGGGRWGHTGWQRNRPCLRASHLLPSAHWFCPFWDQINQLLCERLEWNVDMDKEKQQTALDRAACWGSAALWDAVLPVSVCLTIWKWQGKLPTWNAKTSPFPNNKLSLNR